jgi:ubiquitin-protein ligase E3 C
LKLISYNVHQREEALVEENDATRRDKTKRNETKHTELTVKVLGSDYETKHEYRRYHRWFAKIMFDGNHRVRRPVQSNRQRRTNSNATTAAVTPTVTSGGFGTGMGIGSTKVTTATPSLYGDPSASSSSSLTLVPAASTSSSAAAAATSIATTNTISTLLHVSQSRKENVLHAAQERRIQRAIQQQKYKSAIVIQKYYRRLLAQRKLVRYLEHNYLTWRNTNGDNNNYDVIIDNNNNNNGNGGVSLAQYERALNVRIRLTSQCPEQVPGSIHMWMRNYASLLDEEVPVSIMSLASHVDHSSNSNIDDSMDIDVHSCPTSAATAPTSATRPRSLSNDDSYDFSGYVRYILQECYQVLRDHASSTLFMDGSHHEHDSDGSQLSTVDVVVRIVQHNLLIPIRRDCNSENQGDRTIHDTELSALVLYQRLGGWFGFCNLVCTIHYLSYSTDARHRPPHLLLLLTKLVHVAKQIAPGTSMAGQALLGYLIWSLPSDDTVSLHDNENALSSFSALVMVCTTSCMTNTISSLTLDVAEKKRIEFVRNFIQRSNSSLIMIHALHRAWQWWHASMMNPLQQAIQQKQVLSQQITEGLHSLLLLTRYVLIYDKRMACEVDSWISLGREWNENETPDGAQGNRDTRSIADVEGDSDSDDDDNDEDTKETNTAPIQNVRSITASLALTDESSKKARTSSPGSLTKADVSTVHKLDRLYQRKLQLWMRDETSRSDVPARRDLARWIGGQPELWAQWGLYVFATTNSTIQIKNSSETESIDETYLSTLSLLLQSCTGLQTRRSASSPFLTFFAFQATSSWLQGLWFWLVNLPGAAIETNSRLASVYYSGLCVFSDVWSHQLVAYKDDQFLEQYTETQTSEQRKRPAIAANEVIVRLRELLYDLYWCRPVCVYHVEVPSRILCEEMSVTPRLEPYVNAVRARLLLTGTKLWNSIYERYCRLQRRSPFCEETGWLFPPLSIFGDQGNATATTTRRSRRSDFLILDLTGDRPRVREPTNSDSEDDHDRSQVNPRVAVGEGGDHDVEALADSFRGPRLSRILASIPQAVPFSKRVLLFHSLLKAEKSKTQDESREMARVMDRMMRGEEEGSFRHEVKIHRSRLFDDAMKQLNRLGPKLKKKLSVSFVSKHGTTEAGIDGGGLFNELIDELVKDAFRLDDSKTSTNRHVLFSVTPLQTLTVNPLLTDSMELLRHYEFLGRVLGKAMYESILVEPQFCLPFLNQMIGKSNSLEDLKNMDPEYYKNLTTLLNLSADQIIAAGLTFELTTFVGKDGASGAKTVELLKGGRNKSVTKANVIQYVHLLAHYQLNVRSVHQTKAFMRGFRDLIPSSWVRLFSAYELQKLISGDDTVNGVDITSLKRAMQYGGGYHPSQAVMLWFWEIVEELDDVQQKKFLKFMTSCSRQPLLGFSSLSPPPCVYQVRIRDDIDGNAAPLPTASTCFNLLKLPNYPSKELMKRKLVASIESEAGFELS